MVAEILKVTTRWLMQVRKIFNLDFSSFTRGINLVVVSKDMFLGVIIIQESLLFENFLILGAKLRPENGNEESHKIKQKNKYALKS